MAKQVGPDHRDRKPVHGDKPHGATDEGADLVRGVEVTTANIHDAAELTALRPSASGTVDGDNAFRGARSANASAPKACRLPLSKPFPGAEQKRCGS